MTDTRETIKRSYPLPVYNFRVTVGGTTMRFSEVSGIAVSYDEATYRHGLSYADGEEITTFYFDSFQPVTLKRGMIRDAGPLALHDWLGSKELKTVEVSLCDETGTPVLSWHIARAVPVKLEAPPFDASSNDAAIESLELRARGISLVKP